MARQSNIEAARDEADSGVYHLQQAMHRLSLGDPFGAVDWAEEAKSLAQRFITRARTEARKQHARHTDPDTDCYLCAAKQRREEWARRTSHVTSPEGR